MCISSHIPKIKIRGNYLYFLLFIYCIPIFVFTFYFFRYPISKEPADWAILGNYLGGIYTGLTPLFVLYLTHIINKRRYIDQKKIEILNRIHAVFKNLKDNSQDIHLINELSTIAINERSLITPFLFKSIIKYTDRLKELYGKKQFDYSIEKELNEAIIQEYHQYR